MAHSHRPESDAREESQERDLGIVIGYDGSDSAQAALEWAAAEAVRTDTELLVVTAYTIPSFTAIGMESAFIAPEDESIRQGAQAVADHGADTARRRGARTAACAQLGDAAGVMRDLTSRARMLVLGSRGRGGFVGLLVGSVASAVPGHAKCPVVIVPAVSEEAEPGANRSGIVVGVDGSERGRVAALVAAERAQELGAGLELLCALPPYNAAVAWVPPSEAVETLKEEILVQLEAGSAWLTSHFPGLDISFRLEDGTPAHVLVDATSSAQLTVVGARGGGALLGMLLGSTSQAVLAHTRGPLMIVPDGDDPRLGNRSEFGPGRPMPSL